MKFESKIHLCCQRVQKSLSNKFFCWAGSGICDSGGGDGVACLSQTHKALCVFVNLHSQNTHRRLSFAKLLNLLLYLVIYLLSLLFVEPSFNCNGKQIIFRWLNAIIY